MKMIPNDPLHVIMAGKITAIRVPMSATGTDTRGSFVGSCCVSARCNLLKHDILACVLRIPHSALRIPWISDLEGEMEGEMEGGRDGETPRASRHAPSIMLYALCAKIFESNFYL
jgi:hypothetical protein